MKKIAKKVHKRNCSFGNVEEIIIERSYILCAQVVRISLHRRTPLCCMDVATELGEATAHCPRSHS